MRKGISDNPRKALIGDILDRCIAKWEDQNDEKLYDALQELDEEIEDFRKFISQGKPWYADM